MKLAHCTCGKHSVGLIRRAVSLCVGSVCVAAMASDGTTRYLDEVFSEVSVTRDLVYREGAASTGESAALLLDLYQPTGDAAEMRPAIVWIHGGGFYKGDKTDPNMMVLADRFARRGYVTVSIDYRLAPRDAVDPSLPTFTRAALAQAVANATDDARAAVRWLRESAEQLRIEEQRIAIGGGSAGAFTSLSLAYTTDAESGSGGQTSAVRAVVDFWGGLLDAAEMKAGGPPLLIIHGTMDRTVPFAYAQRLVNRAGEVGVTFELHRLEGEGHAAWTSMDQYIAWIAPFLFRHVAVTGTVGSAESAAADDWTIVPGVHAGRLTAQTSEQDLVELYGPGNVIPSDIPIGEGMTEPGTLLFPEDPRRRVAVIWKSPAREGAKQVRVFEEGTLWTTDKGITIGTPLQEIERINRGPFVLAGFDWDYGGTVMHCNGGALGEVGRQTEDGLGGRKLILRLAPRGVPQNNPDYAKVKGDRDFSSGHPSMQALNPVVYEVIALLEED